MIKYSKFKGNPTIELMNTRMEKHPFSFGAAKALQVCARLDELVLYYRKQPDGVTFTMKVNGKDWILTKKKVDLILQPSHLSAIINFAEKNQRGKK